MNKKIFIEKTYMDTQTVFHANGDINIYPCVFELGQQIVSDGNRASQKGRMVTENDGTSHFRHYRHDSGSRYNQLFTTLHGDVKECNSQVIFTLRFPKKYGKALIEQLFGEETDEMKAYIATRKETTNWEKNV